MNTSPMYRLGTQRVYAASIGMIQARGAEEAGARRGGAALGVFIPRVEDGCRHAASCFTCPLPDCQYQPRRND